MMSPASCRDGGPQTFVDLQVIAQHGEEMTEEAVQDMPYARACVKEVLRLHPSVAFVFRRALRDFEYEGFLIRKVCA